jgi:hypothetical protein
VRHLHGSSLAKRVDAHDWPDYIHLGRVEGRWLIINVLRELRPGGGAE